MVSLLSLPHHHPTSPPPHFCRLTGELRESLVKLAKSHAEKAKVGVRKARQKGMVDLKKAKSAVSEDTIHRLEKYVSKKKKKNCS